MQCSSFRFPLTFQFPLLALFIECSVSVCLYALYYSCSIIYYIYTVHHDVNISESTNKRKRCDKEGEYSGTNPSVGFISESEDESHCKTSKGYNSFYVEQTIIIMNENWINPLTVTLCSCSFHRLYMYIINPMVMNYGYIYMVKHD